MKPTTLTLIVAALLLAISASVAADKPSAAQPTADKPAPAPATTVKKTDVNTKPAAQKEVNVTGSYIKQTVDKHGVLASVGASSLIIIDSETIRRTGASSIPDLFRRTGYAR